METSAGKDYKRELSFRDRISSGSTRPEVKLTKLFS